VRPPIDGGTIVITGTSSGIGREMARLLAPRAKRLILVARRKDRLDALAEELSKTSPSTAVDVAPCDLSSAEATSALADRLLDAHERIDVLVNNAGLADFCLYEQARWDKLLTVLHVNIDALALLSHRFLPRMIAARRGGILNISSGWGLYFMPGFATYVGTKHFVTGFTESLRLEVRGAGVTVTQVCPGPVATEFEEVSGNPIGRSVPSFISMSPERCARIALSGFDRGRALVVPGWSLRLLYGLGGHAPRWLLRLVFAPVGTLLRKRLRGAA
jgi:hypothetical protein